MKHLHFVRPEAREMLQLTAGRIFKGGWTGEGGSLHSLADIQHFNAQSNQNTVFNFRLTAVTSRNKQQQLAPIYFGIFQSFDFFSFCTFLEGIFILP